MNKDNQLRNKYTVDVKEARAKRRLKAKAHLQELHSEKTNILISETDPNHAYGPNYYMLPRSLKLYYKYMRLRKFVHIQLEDEREIIHFNYTFYGSTALSIFGTYGLFYGLYSLMKRSSNHRISNLGFSLLRMPVFSLGVPASLAGSLVYGYLNVYFVKNYVEKFLEKYTAEGVENGFENYDLSEDKGGESWTNIYHVFKM